MRDMVKAAVLTAPRNIEGQQFSYPEMPKNGAIIRTELSGICGTDKHTYSLDKAKEMYAFDGEGFAFGDTVVNLGAGPLGICQMIKARMLGADKVIMDVT